jgi:hypothetical protein
MEIDNSNKNYSRIIAGILVISVLFVLIAAFIGCWGNSIFKQGGVQKTSIGMHPNAFLDTGNNNDEPVAQNDIHVDFIQDETDQGTITCSAIQMDTSGDTDYDDSYDSVFDQYLMPFPICIKETVTVSVCGRTCNVLDWYMYVDIVGGYTPDGLSYIYITQDCKDGNVITGIIKIKWVEDTTFIPTCCNEKRYEAYFWIDPVCDTTWDKICLCSNWNPATEAYDLNKLVEVDFVFNWKGCNGDDQEFMYILVHKNYFSGVPNSRLKFIAR